MTPVDIEPCRLLVLADLFATCEQPTIAELSDPADFQRLLKTLAPAVRVEVPNLVGTAPPTLEVQLKLSSLRDLSPPGLLERVPALAPVHELLKLLGRDAAVSSAELSAALSAPGLERLSSAQQEIVTPPAESKADTPSGGDGLGAAGAGDVDRILSLVDVPSAEERAASAIGKVVDAIGRRRSAPAAERRSLLQTIQIQVGRQIDAILHHPEVQALEAVWRGLRHLVNRCDFRRGLRLFVLHAPRRALLDEHLLDRVQEGTGGAGLDLMLAPTHLQDPAADAAVAEHLGGLAAELQVPLVFSLGLNFFGPPTDDAELRLSHYKLEPPQYVRWRALREKEQARWLAAACNRFLLRTPYSPEGEAASGAFGYREGVGSDSDYAWGDPVWLVGGLAFRSFTRLGWPTEILGSPAGRCDDMAVRTVQRPGGAPRRLAVEQLINMDTVQDLALTGFLVVYAAPDTDATLILAAPSFYHQPAPGPRRGPVIGLPYQAAAGRVVRLLESWRTKLVGRPPDEQVRALESSLRELVAGSGPGAAVMVSTNPPAEASAPLEFNVVLKLGAAVMGGASLELRFAQQS